MMTLEEALRAAGADFHEMWTVLIAKHPWEAGGILLAYLVMMGLFEHLSGRR